MDCGAAGANLVRASHLILMHPCVFPTFKRVSIQEEQAIGRMRRQGQTKEELTVWRLYVKGSIEEVIYREQRAEKKAAALLNGKSADK